MGCVSTTNKPKGAPISNPTGVSIGETFLQPVLSHFPSARTYSGRIQKWTRCEERHSSISSFHKSSPRVFIRRLYKGPPTQFRAEAWLSLSAWTGDDSQYSELTKRQVDVEVEIAIQKDLDRTYPDVEYFRGKGRTALEEVLKAFALAEPDVGYVQGLNFIAGLCLMVTGGDSPKSFHLLRYLLTVLRLKGLFTENLPKLIELLDLFHHCMDELFPQLRPLFEAKEVNDGLWLTKWLLSLYACSLPLHVVVRIWDVLLHQGPIFLVKVGLALLRRERNSFNGCDCGEISEKLKKLGQDSADNPDLLVFEALRVKIPRRIRPKAIPMNDLPNIDEEPANITTELRLQPRPQLL